MVDQANDRMIHTVENGGYVRQPFELNVECAKRGDDDEIRQDECPASGPRPPEAASDVRDPDADLDRERPGQGLADRDAFPHFFLRQPVLLASELPLHLTY